MGNPNRMMHRAQSTAYLPADKVKAAANAALNKLLAERAGVESIMVRDHARVSGWFRTKDWAKRNLPAGHRFVAEQYRMHDQHALIAIIDLATSAMRLQANLTMDITAADFQLIKEFYDER